MGKTAVHQTGSSGPRTGSTLTMTVTGKQQRLPVKTGALLVVSIESWYLLLQLLYWQSRRVALPGLDPQISGLSPERADSLFRTRRGIFFGNLMVSTPTWKLKALEALYRHVRAWPIRIKKTLNVAEPPADLSAFDGIESAMLSELLGAGAAKMDQAKKLAEDLLKNFGAAHPGMPHGRSPVFDTASGAYGFLDNGEIGGLLDSADGLFGTSGGGPNLNPFSSDKDGSNKSDMQLDGEKDKAEAQVAAGGAMMAYAGLLLAASATGPGVIVFAAGGLLLALKGANEWYWVGEAKVKKGSKGGDNLPGNNEVDEKRSNTIGYHIPKKSTSQVLQEIEAAKSGYTVEGDLRKSQKAIMLMKWQVTHPGKGATLSAIFNKKFTPPDKEDDTGLTNFEWIGKMVLTTPVPKGDTPDPEGTEYDNVGKDPGFPPKALGFATDYIDTSGSLQDLTIEYEVSADAG